MPGVETRNYASKRKRRPVRESRDGGGAPPHAGRGRGLGAGPGPGWGAGAGARNARRCVSWRGGARARADVRGPGASRARGDAGRQVGGGGKRRERERERGKRREGVGEEGTFYHVTGAARPGVSVWRRLR